MFTRKPTGTYGVVSVKLQVLGHSSQSWTMLSVRADSLGSEYVDLHVQVGTLVGRVNSTSRLTDSYKLVTVKLQVCVSRVNLVKSICMFEWVCNAHKEVDRHIRSGISEVVVGLETLFFIPWTDVYATISMLSLSISFYLAQLEGGSYFFSYIFPYLSSSYHLSSAKKLLQVESNCGKIQNCSKIGFLN